MINFQKYYQFLQAKWIFKKPIKKKYVIYDGDSKDILQPYFPKKDTAVFYTRYEEINIYVLFKAILTSGLGKIFANYEKIYFDYLKPKMVLNLVDMNLNFYKLKKNFPNTKFVGIQRTPRLATRELAAFKDHKDLMLDYFFCFSKFHSIVFKKLIKIKNTIEIGSFVNNHFSFKSKKNNKILFVGISSSEHIFDIDIKCLNLIAKYAEVKKIKKVGILLKPSSRVSSKYNRAMNLLKDKLGKNFKYFKFLGGYSRKKNYLIASKYKNIIFNRSTMGYECLAKKSRIVALTCLSSPPNYDWDYFEKRNYLIDPFANDFKFKTEGFCWTTDTGSENFVKLVDNVFYRMTSTEWEQKVKKYFKNLTIYDPGNRKFKNFIKK